MKKIVILGVSGFVLWGQFAMGATRLGEVSFGGNACQADPGETLTATIHSGRLQIPLTSTIRKPASQTIARGTCNFSLPLQLPENYRLVLRDPTAVGSLSLGAGVRSRASVEIFQAGSQGNPLVSEDGSLNQRVNKQLVIRQKGEVLATECGARLILRGNASVMLQGSAKASGSLYYISTKASLQECR